MSCHGNAQLEQLKRERDQLEERAVLAETRLASTKACIADQARFYKRQVDDNRAIAEEHKRDSAYADLVEVRAARAESCLAEVERWCKRKVADNVTIAQEAVHRRAEAEEEVRRLSHALAHTRYVLTRPEQSSEPPRDDLLPAAQTNATQVQPPPRKSKEAEQQRTKARKVVHKEKKKAAALERRADALDVRLAALERRRRLAWQSKGLQLGWNWATKREAFRRAARVLSHVAEMVAFLVDGCCYNDGQRQLYCCREAVTSLGGGEVSDNEGTWM